ncbi:hypothetical protein ACFLU1_00820 [Chloroflexota bacterium]
MQKRLLEMDFEGKRLALEMMGITIWVDDEHIEITGTIEPSIVLTPSFYFFPPSPPRGRGTQGDGVTI